MAAEATFARSRAWRELCPECAGWARAVEKDGVCHVFLSGAAGEVHVDASALPSGYDWPAGGISVTLPGEDAAPVAISAPAVG